jgi:hypothetical protein
VKKALQQNQDDTKALDERRLVVAQKKEIEFLTLQIKDSKKRLNRSQQTYKETKNKLIHREAMRETLLYESHQLDNGVALLLNGSNTIGKTLCILLPKTIAIPNDAQNDANTFPRFLYDTLLLPISYEARRASPLLLLTFESPPM